MIIKHRRSRAGWVVGAMMVALFGAVAAMRTTRAVEDTSPWLDSSTYISESTELPEDETFPLRTIAGGVCVPYEFVLQKAQAPIVSDCAVLTQFGFASGPYIHETGEVVAGEIPALKGHIPIPNSSTILTAESKSSGANVRVFSNYDPAANKVLPGSGRIWYNLPGAGGDSGYITDKSGNRLALFPNTIRSSSNGEWIMAYLYKIGMVRVNLATLDVLPFSDSRGSTALTISNSGRYAAVYYTNDHAVRVFDLSTCQAVPVSITKPVDCQFKDISGYLASTYGAIQVIKSLSFAGEHNLSVDLEYLDGSGQTRRSVVHIAPNGYDIVRGGYMALGDSFASGEGDTEAGWYELGTDEPANKCHLSRRSYPYLIAATVEVGEFHSVACSGAVTEHLMLFKQNDENPIDNGLGKWLPGSDLQINFLRNNPSAITISIGGNNIGFAGKLTECVIGPGTCKYAEDGEYRAGVAREIAYLSSTLRGVYKQIIAATGGRTRIYVIGYPQIVKPDGGSCGHNVHLNDTERRFVYEGTKYLNQVIKASSQSAGVYYVDVENTLEDHNLCSLVSDQSMAVNGLTQGNDKGAPWYAGFLAGNIPGAIVAANVRIGNESYHPNPLGHEFMFETIMNLTDGDPLAFTVCPQDPDEVICPGDDGTIPEPDGLYWGESAAEFVGNLNQQNPAEVIDLPQYAPLLVEDTSGSTEITVNMSLLEPGSTARLEIQSDPLTLGEFTVGADGKLVAQVLVPDSIPTGFHTLRLYGLNTIGESVEYYEHIFVPGPEGDVDANGMADSEQACGFVEDSGIDYDQDSIDDACDAIIGAAPEPQPGSVAGESDTGEQGGEGNDPGSDNTPDVTASVHNPTTDGPSVVVAESGDLSRVVTVNNSPNRRHVSVVSSEYNNNESGNFTEDRVESGSIEFNKVHWSQLMAVVIFLGFLISIIGFVRRRTLH